MQATVKMRRKIREGRERRRRRRKLIEVTRVESKVESLKQSVSANRKLAPSSPSLADHDDDSRRNCNYNNLSNKIQFPSTNFLCWDCIGICTQLSLYLSSLGFPLFCGVVSEKPICTLKTMNVQTQQFHDYCLYFSYL